MSNTDRLTGLLTDEYLRDDLDLEFQRARRFKRELSFMLFEPCIGDAASADMAYSVLKSVARQAAPKIRDIDTGVRWGQRILVVMPETGRAGAEVVEKKIRDGFSKLVFKHPETEREVPVKLRSAILVYPQDGADKDALLNNLRERLQAASSGQSTASTT